MESEALLPEHAVVSRTARDESGTTILATCDGCSVLIQPRLALIVTVSAMRREEAERLAATIRQRVTEPKPDGTVGITTWHMVGPEVYRRSRRIQAPEWRAIAPNYPRSTRGQLEPLQAIVCPRTSAKLIIWYGPPGTGKTTALRALARRWQPWCNADYVVDPERLFAHPGYLEDVATHAGDRRIRAARAATERRFNLTIAEDCDEFLRASARRDVGAGLGRLLNLSDGILGQGLDTLVLLTTNEPLQALDPALVRPGRCLASLHVELFPVNEAREWLANPRNRIDTPVSLAQLFELRGDFEGVITNPTREQAIGQYL
jgi:hypothetical protein